MLVGLYEEPERPPNAVEYVKKVMGAPVGVDVDALRAENEQLRQMVDRLTKECVGLFIFFFTPLQRPSFPCGQLSHLHHHCHHHYHHPVKEHGFEGKVGQCRVGGASKVD